VEALFYPMFPDTRKSIFLVGSQAVPFRPSGKSNVHMKVGTEHWWNGINREKPKQQEKSPRATLCTTNLIWVKDGNLRN